MPCSCVRACQNSSDDPKCPCTAAGDWCTEECHPTADSKERSCCNRYEENVRFFNTESKLRERLLKGDPTALLPDLSDAKLGRCCCCNPKGVELKDVPKSFHCVCGQYACTKCCDNSRTCTGCKRKLVCQNGLPCSGVVWYDGCSEGQIACMKCAPHVFKAGLCSECELPALERCSSSSSSSIDGLTT